MDDPGGSSYYLWMTISLLGLSALFSAAETAFFASSPLRLRQLSREKPQKTKLVQSLLSDSQRFLSTLLVGNTAVNIWLTALITTVLLNHLSGGLGKELAGLLATLLTTILLLVFGEVTPKAIAASLPEASALFLSKPVALFHKLLSPATALLHLITGGNRKSVQRPLVTEDAIITAVGISEENGMLPQKNEAMIKGIFASDDTTVAEIMIPQRSVASIDVKSSPQVAIQMLIARGYSRLPIFSQSRDQIIGFVHAKDLLVHLYQEQATNLRELLRPVLRCPATRKADELLRQMQQKGIHLAIVTDAEGKAVGLITMEDLLEEIVGDIVDEHDKRSGGGSPQGVGAALC